MKIFLIAALAFMTLAATPAPKHHHPPYQAVNPVPDRGEKGDVGAHGPTTMCGHCGTEFWLIKTLTDTDAGKIDYTPAPTTIEALDGTTAPTPDASRSRVCPTECKLWKIRACLTLVKHEADSDYHLVLHSMKSPSVTMIGEIPDPKCSGACKIASNVPKYTAERSLIDQLTLPAVLDLTGIGFFDKIHGQTGVAPNGVELHPLLRIQEVTGETC